MNNKSLKPLLIDLLESGMSQAGIAREIGLTRATVNSVLKQNTPWIPNYLAGKKLVDLHTKTLTNQ